jgi:hypothetical protein
MPVLKHFYSNIGLASENQTGPSKEFFFWPNFQIFDLVFKTYLFKLKCFSISSLQGLYYKAFKGHN